MFVFSLFPLSVCVCLRLGVADLHSALQLKLLKHLLLLTSLLAIHPDYHLPVLSLVFLDSIHQFVVKPSVVHFGLQLLGGFLKRLLCFLETCLNLSFLCALDLPYSPTTSSFAFLPRNTCPATLHLSILGLLLLGEKILCCCPGSVFKH